MEQHVMPKLTTQSSRFRADKNDGKSSVPFLTTQVSTVHPEAIKLETLTSDGNFVQMVKMHRPMCKEKLRKSNGLMLVTGLTGSGKSTIIPLSLMLNLGASDKPVCCAVPKRVACRMLCDRQKDNANLVGATEANIGYCMKDDRERNASTKLLYVTAGWLFAYITANKTNIFQFSTIILDEIHDKSSDVEMLLAALHYLQNMYKIKGCENDELCKFPIYKRRLFPKLVMMSATANMRKIFNHFRDDQFYAVSGFSGRCEFEDVSLNIGKALNDEFEVEEYFLEELEAAKVLVLNSVLADFNEGPSKRKKIRPIIPRLTHCMAEIILYSIKVFSSREEYSTGNVLIFVGGISDMTLIINKYKWMRKDNKEFPELDFILFHSKINAFERRLLAEACDGQVASPRKIILATNVAETSLTLKNISIVLDTGLVKMPNYNQTTDCETLEQYWADKLSIEQRRGRVGRVRNGVYVYLGTTKHYLSLRENPSEVERQSLDELVARLLGLQNNILFKENLDFLHDFATKHMINRPNIARLNESVGTLIDGGAIMQLNHNYTTQQSPTDDLRRLQFTPIGKMILLFRDLPAKLASQIYIGGEVFLNTEDSIFMAACELEDHLDVFVNETVYIPVFLLKLFLTHGEPSDHEAMINLFRAWLKASSLSRLDAQDKKSLHTTDKLTKLYSHKGREVEAWDLRGVFLKSMTKMDTNASKIYKKISNPLNGMKIRIPPAYKAATLSGDPNKNLPPVRLRENFISSLVPASTSALKYWYMSEPDIIKYCPRTDADLQLTHIIILKPAPPDNFDLKRYGSKIQQKFSMGLNIYPEVYIDHANDRVLLQYPFAGRHNYLGKCHPSPVALLHALDAEKRKHKEVKWTLRYFPSSEPKKETSIQPTFLPPTPLIITSETKVFIANFTNPYFFSVRPTTKESIRKFYELYQSLFKIGKSKLLKLFPSQAVLGGTVIVLTPTSSPPPAPGSNRNIFNHHHRRGIIMANISNEEVPVNFQKHIQILVETIDMGECQFYDMENVFFYDSESMNYGEPDLFKYTRLSYQCVMQGVSPISHHGYCWRSENLTFMSGKLKNKEQEFKGFAVLDIVETSKEDSIIVCNDIWTTDRKFSFKSWILSSGYATEEEYRLVDLRRRPLSDNVLPSPLKTPLFEQDIPKQKDKSIAPTYNEWIVQEAFSPLEVVWRSCINLMSDIPVKTSLASINSHFLDSRINAKPLDQYQPLLLVASDVRYFESQNGNFKQITLDSSTVYPPISDIVPIFALLFQPVVAICKSKQTGYMFSLRVYKKMPRGRAKFASQIPLHFVFGYEDMNEITSFREHVNKLMLCSEGPVADISARNLVLKLINKKRNPLPFHHIYLWDQTEDISIDTSSYLAPFLFPPPFITGGFK